MSPTTHVALPGSERPAKRGATRVAAVDPAAPVEVTVTLRGPDLPGPDQLPEQSLTPEEFASAYGASQADADHVAKVLSGYGLSVDEVDLPGRALKVTGSAADVEAAFHPGLAIYHSADQGNYRGREGSVMVPAQLDGIVTGVFGLDQRRVARRKASTLAAAPAVSIARVLPPLAPADLEARYNFPPGDGTGQQIAIAEFGGGYFPDDLTAFAAKHHRPVPAVSLVPVNAPALTLKQILHLPKRQRDEVLGESAEVMMDVQVIAGLCPKAHISVYFATFDQMGWVDLLNRAIADRPVALSVSWGAPEDDAGTWSAAARAAVNDRLAAAALLGITVCVAAGDDGSGDELADGRAHVDFPSSSPFVLGVGGTMLTSSGTKVSERVWFEAPGTREAGGGATGGGVSTVFPRPAWQNVTVASVNHGAIDGRVVPDVSALAGEPFYDLTLLGHDAPNGGTSASAPVWAALVARLDAQLPAGKRQRFLTPLLYQAGAGGAPRGKLGCRDVTSGSNASTPPGKGYSAKAGFDAVSGWGVPNGTKLLAALGS